MVKLPCFTNKQTSQKTILQSNFAIFFHFVSKKINVALLRQAQTLHYLIYLSIYHCLLLSYLGVRANTHPSNTVRWDFSKYSFLFLYSCLISACWYYCIFLPVMWQGLNYVGVVEDIYLRFSSRRNFCTKSLSYFIFVNTVCLIAFALHVVSKPFYVFSKAIVLWHRS